MPKDIGPVFAQRRFIIFVELLLPDFFKINDCTAFFWKNGKKY